MRVQPNQSRRAFLGGALAWAAAPAMLRSAWAGEVGSKAATRPAFELVDYHVHLDNSSIDQVLPLARERGVRFGIVEHAGTRENKYPVVLSDDEELSRYLAMLEGKGVYRGVQAEWTDWAKCFSREMLGRLDFTLGDAMTFPGKDGRRVKLWEKGVEERVDLSNAEAFMDRFVEWHVEIIATQPIDILANVSWLPDALAGAYDRLWTHARVRKVVDAAVKHRVALEISSSYKLPRPAFLKVAKEAGVKFTFGSNGRYPKMGLLAYSVEMAKSLGLKQADLFTPAREGEKAVQRRRP